ncbi:MAG: PqiA/YebS family transporter subunit [Magnetococcus sp. DMHC-1]|nr:PqiA/YebS family transporter subunit [Magnetococcales bacterium]
MIRTRHNPLPESHPGTRVTTCPECALPQKLPALSPRIRALRCQRCDRVLRRFHPDSLDRTLAMVVTGSILLTMAILLPFLTLELNGQLHEITLGTGVATLYQSGSWELATLVLLTSIVAPLLNQAGQIYVLLPLRLGIIPRHAGHIWRRVLTIGPWSMLEVYLLGVLVAYVKLAQMATVTPGPALFCFTAAMLSMIVGQYYLDPDLLWSRMPVADPPASPTRQCPLCGLEATSHAQPCRRCGLHPGHDKPDSLNRTWAWVITAAILYIPANLLPIMTVIRVGQKQSDTILSGVAHLANSGMWLLALVVFVASILVPILKLLILTGLLLSIHRRQNKHRRQRTHIYRWIELIGRWSMIDIFMISILVAIVDLGEIATIHPGPGAVFFAAVVVVTMLAAEAFDPRLLWVKND